MKSALITVTTWRFERIVKVFRVYFANICWLPLCCYGYSLNLPICRSRVRIPQGLFSSWTVVQFKKKDFPPKLIFFFYSKSKTCKKSISLEVRGFFSGSWKTLIMFGKNDIGSAGGRTQDLSRVRRTW